MTESIQIVWQILSNAPEFNEDTLILVLLTLKFPNFNYLYTMKEEVKLHIYKPDLSTELELPYADGGIKVEWNRIYRTTGRPCSCCICKGER